MKKGIFAAALTAVLAFSAYSGYADASGMLSNGDFEQGLSGWKSTWQSGNGTLEVVPVDGNNALHFKSDAGRAYISQDLRNITEGDRITLSFRLKVLSLVEGGSAVITFGYRDKAGQYITQEGWSCSEISGDKWIYKSTELIVPEGTGSMYILVRLNEGGEIYYDDLEFTDFYNETKLTVTKGGMELVTIPQGIGEVTAKLHYVPKEQKESGNLIFAMYDNAADGKKLIGVKIQPFTATRSIFTQASLTVPDNSQNVTLSAYVWKNGQTAEPVTESVTLPRKGRNSVFDTFAAEKMRGAYGAHSVFYDKEKMAQLESSGINTFIFNLIGDVNKDSNALDKLCLDMESYVEETGRQIFLKASYGANSVVGNTSYGAYHPGKKNELGLPCPLAEEYWDKEMMSRFEVIAKHPKIIGIVFDMEMYSGGDTRYHSVCLCDSCVKKYAQADGGDVALSLTYESQNDRLQYLYDNCIHEEYSKWFKGEVTAITTKLRERLHAINPNLIIGVMPSIEWLGGMTKGLGTEEMPLMIFIEDTYKGTLAITNVKKAMAELNDLNAVFAVGLWSNNESAINTYNFASKVEGAEPYDVGYWIYAIQELDKDPAFYEELKKGNDKIISK
ncbi:MAG: hypothetical protein IJ366_02090 [Clostridia bacterium]|nr:hypothetical protein [Clostridia bacterium]